MPYPISYPTAEQFVEAFGEAQLRRWLAKRIIGGIRRPLSISVALPAYNARYIGYLEVELALVAGLVGKDRVVGQLQFGGATPSQPEMARLRAALEARFILERSAPAPQGLCDVLAFGVAAIGCIGPTYYQNHQGAEAYCAALDQGRLPVARGIELTADDLARRAVIQGLACNFRVSIEAIELAHLIDFRTYFAAELADLQRLAQEGLVEMAGDWICLTPEGRLASHAVCMTFDRYLRRAQESAACTRIL